MYRFSSFVDDNEHKHYQLYLVPLTAAHSFQASSGGFGGAGAPRLPRAALQSCHQRAGHACGARHRAERREARPSRAHHKASDGAPSQHQISNTTTAKDRPRAVYKSLGCVNAHAVLLAELAPQRNQQRLAALELGARNDMQPLRLACNAASARRMRHADGSALLQYAHDDVATPERVLHGQRGGALIATTLAKGDVRSMHASRPVNNSTRESLFRVGFAFFIQKAAPVSLARLPRPQTTGW